MENTPPIPSDIKTFCHPKYVNIYSLCPYETRLYGTESLYGNWNGQLLLLAKDFAPSRLIDKRMVKGDTRPYRHTDWQSSERVDGMKPVGWRTNKRLCKYVEPITCGMLYGSALANLLRKDERGSGTLPALSDPRIKEFISKVLRFTVSHMPNLQAIACLGKVAWDCVTETYNQRDANWNEYRNAPEPLQVEHLKIFALAHPAYTHGGIEKVNNDWKKLRENFEASGSKR